MGYDQDYIGNYQYLRKKIAFFPYAGGPTLASTSVGQAPGHCLPRHASSNGPTNVLYRVDAGGPAIAPNDGGPTWVRGHHSQPQPLRQQQPSTTGSLHDPVGNVTVGRPGQRPPSGLRQRARAARRSCRRRRTTSRCPQGTKVTVRLYFANRCTSSPRRASAPSTSAQRATVLSNYDVVADAGQPDWHHEVLRRDRAEQRHLQRHRQDQLARRTGTPLINGIEILNSDVPRPHGAADNLSSVAFDGSTATAPQPVSGTSIPWGSTRGRLRRGQEAVLWLVRRLPLQRPGQRLRDRRADQG